MQMGEVRTKAIVANPIASKVHPIEVDCLVDTGAVMLMLPRDSCLIIKTIVKK
jgi:hypothetical protein